MPDLASLVKDFETLQLKLRRSRRLRKGTLGRPYGAGMAVTNEEINVAEEIADVGGPTKDDQ